MRKKTKKLYKDYKRIIEDDMKIHLREYNRLTMEPTFGKQERIENLNMFCKTIKEMRKFRVIYKLILSGMYKLLPIDVIGHVAVFVEQYNVIDNI